MERDIDDPRGLIREAYRIDGIGPGECRSIFLDWALGMDDPQAALSRLLARPDLDADHPMTAVLREGQGTTASPRRRGGRSGRLGE